MARKPDGLCTTRCQLFNTEMTRNENKLRMRWFAKNRQLLLENLRDDKLIERAKEMRNKLEENRLQRLREDTENIVEEERSLPAWRPREEENGRVNVDSMKPIDPPTRAIIYEPGVESYLSGRNYLRERYKAKPESRFYYPDCTSWLYGWRLTDYLPSSPENTVENSSIRESNDQRRAPSFKRNPNYCRCRTTNA